MLKKILGKINIKKHSFFSRELQLVTDLLLICDSYMNWSTTFASLRAVNFSIFDSVSFLLVTVFLTKSTALTLIRYNSFQNKGDREATRFCFQTSGF